MEIHELNTKALTDPAYVPFDDGTDTYKAEFNEVVENAANAAVAEADLTNNPVAFTSGDAASPTAWTNVSVITSGSTLATLFNRISTMVKNVRWLYSKLGTTDISSIGGGTVTGAISALNGNVGLKKIFYEYKTTGATGTTKTFTLISATPYLLVVTNVNRTNTNGAGLFFVTPHSLSSNIVTINANAYATVTIDKLTLSIAYSGDYVVTGLYQFV